MAEDKDFLPRPEQTSEDMAVRRVRTRRVPTASTDGTQATSHGSTAHPRRKRVYIVSDDPAPHPSYSTPRSPRSEHTYDSHSSSNYRGHTPSSERSQYDERYQAERTSGNYSYQYNRAERPRSNQGGAPYPGPKKGKKPLKGAPNKKGKGGGKKPRAFVPPPPVKYEEVVDPSQDLRLNKFLANAGVCSRREADLLIAAGQRVSCQSKIYILLNKPKNCVTTSDDPECRKTVMDLVKGACEERIYPVGRLDRNTTGVILITNDGDLSSKLTHPSYMKKKIYHVWLDKPVAIEDMQRIAEGIELEDGEIHADAISYVSEEDLSQVGIEIHSGRNRIVRRIFEHLGYHVHKLDRVYFAGLTKKNLGRGRWRYLTEQEVNNLRMGAFE